MVTLGYNQNNAVLAVKKADVTGDGSTDEIYLTGYKTRPGDAVAKNIDLVVEEGRSGQIIRTTLPLKEGANSRLFTGDFDCDGTADVLVSIDISGNSSSSVFFSLYKCKRNRISLLSDWGKLNLELSFEVDFKENFIVSVYCLNININKKYMINVADSKERYQDIYSRNGKLLKPQKGNIAGLHAIYPVDNRNGCYNLLAVQRVTGRHEADLLGYLETTVKWAGTKFIPEKQFISRFRYYM